MTRFVFTAAVFLLSLQGGAALAFEPIVTPGGTARLIHPQGPVEVLATTAETDGQLGMEVFYDMPDSGPGDQTFNNFKATAVFYVLEGQYRFTVGTTAHAVGPGSVIVVPPKTPHGYMNIGKTVGKLLVTWTPGGEEQTLIDWDASNSRSANAIKRIDEVYGVVRAAPAN